MYFLYHETRRYGELQRCVRGVTHKMLIQQLKELESDGIVSRKDYKEIPPRVEYSLTPLGLTLAEALRPLCDWGIKNEDTIKEALIRRKQG
ncbi:MAG: HxlR family transcriptional regulator [Puniceicoccaceae bacterium 5H]|nr:MAG: HxlR family transcriptional regulator [Puniceicoccaceae bacterium 5H]